ncbi:MAG: thiaminase II [Pseudomonadota bacterium]
MSNNLYGQVFAELRASCPESWWDYTRHAFVEGLKNGSLPEAAFLHYLRQDYVFLMHFSRAWALAIVKAETHDEMLGAVGTVSALISEEIKLHVGICKEAGISEQELFETQEAPANLAYTRYVLEAGYSGDYLDLLAALTPCVMGYGEIGSRLKEEMTSDTYAEWINTYASDEYQDTCIAAGKLVDESVERRIGSDYINSPRWPKLCEKFRMATELEVGFWQMGLTP